MSWRIANSLRKMFDQVNATHPRRDKESDGGIGNAEHASRGSDHNPWVRDGAMGIVTAIDIDHDTEGDEASRFDSYAFAEMLRQRQDERIKYVISNRRIFSGTGQDHTAWEWRKYTGTNAHDHHVHVSVKPGKAYYDDARPWEIDGWKQLIDPTVPQPKTPPPTLRRGSKGPAVDQLQRALNVNGATLKTDGDYGDATEKAVKAFQSKRGLTADGIAGPQTFALLKIENL